MMKRRFLALFLALALVFGLLAGCGKKEDPANSLTETQKDNAENSENGQNQKEQLSKQELYAKNKNAFPDDTLMATVAGEEVYWREYYYWLLTAVEYVLEKAGEIDSWDSVGTDGKTARERVIWETQEVLKLYRTIEIKCAQLGVTLSDEDEKSLADYTAQLVENYGGEEAFKQMLEENFMTQEIFDYSNRVSTLYYALLKHEFGETGELLEEEEVYKYAENLGFVNVKHILIKTVDGDRKPLDDEAVQQAEETVQGIYDQLAAADKAQLPELFDTLMHEKSQDSGLEAYPDGYSFVVGSGTMYAEFETAAGALQVGEMSGIVKTDVGYHILLRTEVDPDVYVDQSYTLRYYAALNAYESLVEGWTRDTEYIETDAAEKIELEEWFPTPLVYN